LGACRRNSASIFHINLEFETVVAEFHMGITKREKAFVGFRVGKLVGDVREPGAAWF